MKQYFYNSTNESGGQLGLFRNKARNQDEAILKFFKQFPDREISPSALLKNGVCDEAPITSIRRSLNTLHKRYEIVKCDNKVESLYGRPEFTYKLAPSTIQKTITQEANKSHSVNN